MIDIQAFRATIAAHIEEEAAEKNINPAVVPLAQVADFASVGAAWAATHWNNVTELQSVAIILEASTKVADVSSLIGTMCRSSGSATLCSPS